MSSYEFKAKNKETGEVKVVSAIDDYFGSHRYGYFIENNVALTDEQFNQYWERIEVTPEKETPVYTTTYAFGVVPDTPKTVEEVVAELAPSFSYKRKGWCSISMSDWLKIKEYIATLLAQNQAADERLRIANDEIRDVKIAHKELVKKMKEERVEADERLREVINENTSDGYHTFKELYEFRLLYNAALFNEWAKQGMYEVHKSTKHSDGEDCFGGGWFIVVATLPNGDISNHYEMKDWDLFQCEVKETAKEWDGHTSQDVARRLREHLFAKHGITNL